MMKQKGFTLIELMIVVAIIGILAAIAIPAYQDYTVRSKMTEAVAGMSAAKVAVSEYFQSQGSMPIDAGVAGFTTDIQAKYLARISYDQTASNTATLIGVITGNLGGNTTTNETVELRASGNDNRVEWDCRPGANDPVATKYLPADCRQ
jgi:type IV pilus assembly protein PilA